MPMLISTLQEMPAQLAYLVTQAAPIFNRFEKDYWYVSRGDGKWTRLELIGHLIDSAANNHQRFVRALAQPALQWPGYDQVAHVAVQDSRLCDSATCIALWSAFNLHLSHVISRITIEKSATMCSIDQASPMTLADLVLDYVAHLEHHLRQLLGLPLPNGYDLKYSGMPWPPVEPNRHWPT